MITIRFNNEAITVKKNHLLIDLLTENGYTKSYYAVALNRCFVQNTDYATTLLCEGDVVEVVMPMQGG